MPMEVKSKLDHITFFSSIKTGINSQNHFQKHVRIKKTKTTQFLRFDHSESQW